MWLMYRIIVCRKIKPLVKVEGAAQNWSRLSRLEWLHLKVLRLVVVDGKITIHTTDVLYFPISLLVRCLEKVVILQKVEVNTVYKFVLHFVNFEQKGTFDTPKVCNQSSLGTLC